MFYLNKDIEKLKLLIKNPSITLVSCFCASWCRVCHSYQEIFLDLSQKYSNYCFIWVDIEENADLIDFYDFNDFPTINIEDISKTTFFGPVLPNFSALDYLIKYQSSLKCQANGVSLFKILE